MNSDSSSLAKREMAGPAIRATGIEDLLMEAVKTGNLDAIERVMAMRRELKAENAREAFFAALSEFQKECPIIRRTKEVHNAPSRGGALRYRYAPLDEIVKTVAPLLTAHGFSCNVQARVEGEPGEQAFLAAVCNVYHAAGHTESSEFRVPIALSDFMNSAQSFAAAATYARRYAFVNALGIVTGGEDAVTPAAARAARGPQAATSPRERAPGEGKGWLVVPQIKMRILNLWAEAVKLGVEESELRALLGTYGCESRKELTAEQAPDFVDELSRLVAGAQGNSSEERRAVVDVCRLLNQRGDDREWSTKVLNDFIKENFPPAAKVDDLNREQLSQLVELLTARFDGLQAAAPNPDRDEEERLALIAEICKTFPTAAIAEELKRTSSKSLDSLTVDQLVVLRGELLPF